MDTILVVDDEEDIRALLAALFRGTGQYRVEQAASGPAALALSLDPVPNLLVTDYRMPGMDGLELARALKARWPSLSVVLLTAYADSSIAELGTGVVDRTCRKSINPGDLLSLVANLLTHSKAKETKRGA